jgi:hypothetical protein
MPICSAVRESAIARTSARPARALDSLQRAFDAGAKGHGVWEFLEGDPAFDSLRGETRFVALVQDVNRHMAAERAEVEKLRASGAIPRR